MNVPAGRALSLGCLILTTAVLSSCGIPLQEMPEAVPPPPIASPEPRSPNSATETPQPSVAPSPSGIDIWFVRSGMLVPIKSDLEIGSSVEEILGALVEGPPSESVDSLTRTLDRDPSSGQPLLQASPPVTDERGDTESTPDPTIAGVALAEAFFSLPSIDQSLLLGQAVMSLTSGGYRAVRFSDSVGVNLAVPLPNGRLLTGPVLRSDFDSLNSQN